MKKVTLAIGLLSLVMTLASFTTPETTSNTKVENVDIIGGNATGGNMKLD